MTVIGHHETARWSFSTSWTVTTSRRWPDLWPPTNAPRPPFCTNYLFFPQSACFLLSPLFGDRGVFPSLHRVRLISKRLSSPFIFDLSGGSCDLDRLLIPDVLRFALCLLQTLFCLNLYVCCDCVRFGYILSKSMPIYFCFADIVFRVLNIGIWNSFPCFFFVSTVVMEL